MHPGVMQTSLQSVFFFTVWVPFDIELLNASAMNGSFSSLTGSVLVQVQVWMREKKQVHNSDKLVSAKRRLYNNLQCTYIENLTKDKVWWD